MIAIFTIEVTTNITHINPKQKNPLKMKKKNGLQMLKLRKIKNNEELCFFVAKMQRKPTKERTNSSS